MKHWAVGKSNEAAILARLSNCLFHASERVQIRRRFLLDTSLSSIQISNDSTRHSVTSRIDRNSRAFCYLIFSTRHLNATHQKRENVEKFNIPVRFFAASRSFPKLKRRTTVLKIFWFTCSGLRGRSARLRAAMRAYSGESKWRFFFEIRGFEYRKGPYTESLIDPPRHPSPIIGNDIFLILGPIYITDAIFFWILLTPGTRRSFQRLEGRHEDREHGDLAASESCDRSDHLRRIRDRCLGDPIRSEARGFPPPAPQEHWPLARASCLHHDHRR